MSETFSRWRKATRSGGSNDACVEVAFARHAVGVRDSKDPAGPVLALPAAAWAAFLTGTRTGIFDQPA